MGTGPVDTETIATKPRRSRAKSEPVDVHGKVSTTPRPPRRSRAKVVEKQGEAASPETKPQRAKSKRPAEAVAAPPVKVSRQVRRQIERRQAKLVLMQGRKQSRPGLPLPPKLVFNKRVIRTEIVGPFERSLHATKGWRCRRVA